MVGDIESAVIPARDERERRSAAGARHRRILRAVREWVGNDDAADNALEDWLAVRVKGKKLSATWLRP